MDSPDHDASQTVSARCVFRAAALLGGSVLISADENLVLRWGLFPGIGFMSSDVTAKRLPFPWLCPAQLPRPVVELP